MSLNVPNCRLKFGTAKLYSDSVLRLLLTVLSLLLPMRMSLHLLLNHLRQKVDVLPHQQLTRLGSSSHVARMIGTQLWFRKLTRNVFFTAK